MIENSADFDMNAEGNTLNADSTNVEVVFLSSWSCVWLGLSAVAVSVIQKVL